MSEMGKGASLISFTTNSGMKWGLRRRFVDVSHKRLCGVNLDENTDRERGCTLDNRALSGTRLPAVRLVEGYRQHLLGAGFPSVGLS